MSGSEVIRRRIEASPPPDNKTLPTFHRAFVEGRADFITLDGWSGKARWDDVRWGVLVGLLNEDPATSRASSDEQYTAACFRPTEHALDFLREQVL